MTIKTRAILKTTFFIATVFLAALGMASFLEFLNPAPRDVIYVVMALLTAFMAYLVYSYNVTEMEYRTKLQEMSKE